MKDALLAREQKIMREAERRAKRKAEKLRVSEHVRAYLNAQEARFALEEMARKPTRHPNCDCCGFTAPTLDLENGACLLCREKADAWG
jgi:hypothetical protein